MCGSALSPHLKFSLHSLAPGTNKASSGLLYGRPLARGQDDVEFPCDRGVAVAGCPVGRAGVRRTARTWRCCSRAGTGGTSCPRRTPPCRRTATHVSAGTRGTAAPHVRPSTHGCAAARRTTSSDGCAAASRSATHGRTTARGSAAACCASPRRACTAGSRTPCSGVETARGGAPATTDRATSAAYRAARIAPSGEN